MNEKTDEWLERGWKWIIRLMGIAGFVYLISTNPNAPVAFYVLLSGLLGLPSVVAYQIAANRSREAQEKDRKPPT